MESESRKARNILADLMLRDVPSYANKFFYSLGFLTMVSFTLLVISGAIMVLFGPDWWLTSPWGVFMRSVHLWSVQAFMVFVILHLIIVFVTEAYRPPRRLTWVLGALTFFLAIAEAEFGYVLRNDFSSQWRSLQGADLYNGSGLGVFLNNLNYAQVYGIHIIFLPLLMLGLLFLHYLFVKVRGIAKPYAPDIPVKTVRANHYLLFARGGALAAVIVLLAVIFPSPFLAPVTIKEVAQNDPSLVATTLLAEIGRTSDTATYLDNIDPYTYDTRVIYIAKPYEAYITGQNMPDRYASFAGESADAQSAAVTKATDYFTNGGKLDTSPNSKNELVPVVSTLVMMAESGLYEGYLDQLAPAGNTTYAWRFLGDTGVLENTATKLEMTTDQYGMVREENHVALPPGAWWLAPIGFLDHTFLAIDPDQDRDGAEILGVLMLLVVAFPFIPYVNRIPEKLKIGRLLWREKQ